MISFNIIVYNIIYDIHYRIITPYTRLYTRLFIQYQAYTYTFFWIYDENVREATPEAQALAGRGTLNAIVISMLYSILYDINVYNMKLFTQYQASPLCGYRFMMRMSKNLQLTHKLPQEDAYLKPWSYLYCI